MRKSNRVMIYIDNSNIFKGFKKYKLKVDYEKLKNLITKQRDLKEIFLYEGIVYPINPNKKKWYNDLANNSNYVIKASFDKSISNHIYEKKVDIHIAIDMVSHAYENMYDTAVLVSGDGDFLPVLKKIKDLGKKIEVWGFKYSLAHVIIEEVGRDNLFYLDDYIEKMRM